MAAKVILEVSEGPVEGPRRFEFDRRDIFIFGRHTDCHARIPEGNKTASRHHFLLEVDPPHAMLRDLGSYNGTWINGVKYGGRQKGERPADVKGSVFEDVALKSGDEIRVGKTLFKVHIVHPKQEETAWEEPEADAAALAGTDPADVMRDILADAARKKGMPSPENIAGHKILRLLGEGGMGAVYLAERQRDGMRLALKIMLAHVAVKEPARKLFARECRNAAQLHHANIVPFFEHGSAGGAFWCTFEYCAAGSLEGLLQTRGGKLGISEAAPLIMDVLAGLAYAHDAPIRVQLEDGTKVAANGVVHRDLKPDNILLTHSETALKPNSLKAKIADFGLAKAFETAGLSGITRGRSAGGTPPFMPREQLTNYVNVKPVSDVWAAAATFYYMLTGRFARDFDNNKDVMLQILQHPVVPIRQRDPSIPEHIARVFDRALDENPKTRIQSASELRSAFGSAL